MMPKKTSGVTRDISDYQRKLGMSALPLHLGCTHIFLEFFFPTDEHVLQVPIAPLQRRDGPASLNQMWQNEPQGGVEHPPEQGIPIMIAWNYGGNDVAVEGSWDNWTSRKTLQRSGKDHSILLVLPSGVYHYKFIVDGEWRYIPDLPFIADEMGRVCNLLDVNVRIFALWFAYVYLDFDLTPILVLKVSRPNRTLEDDEGRAALDGDGSVLASHIFSFLLVCFKCRIECAYCVHFITQWLQSSIPAEEDFAKEPVLVPPQLHLTVLGMPNSEEPSCSKPQHVVLNHLFIEKGWASQSVVALGLTNRFQSKYVTVVLYKPLKSIYEVVQLGIVNEDFGLTPILSWEKWSSKIGYLFLGLIVLKMLVLDEMGVLCCGTVGGEDEQVEQRIMGLGKVSTQKMCKCVNSH
ncbi:SNF1-related protein kinase regulatory subunit beta-2 [Vitis vinifera]|uniref:SNF1-related protein kinase regulatory subunit beta-2 n=1 Tax=Vitis vinifera TaxID=29760 RepID=A0A438DIR3_VITVI|nr:SNF1-related protein kinase regulatory subunit beta-2 [Vitis vinifera]